MKSVSLARDADFEKSLAYMFGVKKPEPIQAEYYAAIVAMDALGEGAEHSALLKAMLPHFKKCYQHIASQLAIEFNIEQAARWEFQLFIAHKQFKEAGEIIQLMKQLYACVLGGEPREYQPAAAMRTEIFCIKAMLERDIGYFSEAQKKYMLSLHQESAAILDECVLRRQKELQESMF